MKSLHKALSIIETLAQMGTAGVRELASVTGYPPATIYRIVSTLTRRQYFKQDPVTKAYSLSLRFLELGTRVQQQFNLVSLARPRLEQLMADTKASVNLAVQDGNEIVYLDHVRCDHTMLQLFTKLGARVPMYSTGVGKMFMSTWNDIQVADYLQRTERIPFTQHTLVNPDDLRREIQRVRSRGFAVDNEEMEEGVRCVASIVVDHNGRPVAAISISGPAMRIPMDRIEYLGEAVKRCSMALSHELGFHPGTEGAIHSQPKGD